MQPVYEQIKRMRPSDNTDNVNAYVNTNSKSKEQPLPQDAMLGVVLNALHILTHWILKINL